jgi:hypothetical protein
MNTKILTCTIIVCILLNKVTKCNAQVPLGKPSWEIGTDLLWFIDKSNTPISFIIKNHRSKLKKDEFKTRHYAYRMRLGANLRVPVDFNAQLNYPDFQVFNNRSYHLYFRPGYELKKKVKPFDFYYGIDVPLSYQNYNVESISTDQGVQQNRKRKQQEFSFGLAPIIGVSITFVDRIKLSVESSIDLTYSITKDRNEIISPNPRLLSESSGNAYQVEFFPIHTIIFSVILN